MSRRTVLTALGALGAAALPVTAGAQPSRRAPAVHSGGRRVAILGGGMAGPAAAHELIERGFEVTVFEPTALGGKARSTPSPGTAAGGRLDLPGEHGFRFFPGFYQHIPDTMRRIPFPGNPNGVFDKLVAGHGFRMAIPGAPDLTAPASIAPLRFDIYDPLSLQESLTAAFSLGGSIPPHELAVFMRKLVMFLTSSLERRDGQWEHETWAQTLEADGKSKGYREILVSALTRQLVSALTRQLVSALTRQLVAAMPAERAVSLWRGDFPQRYGDGSAHDCLSVDISDWDTPGILYGRTARQCTPEEIAREVWAQMSACLEDGTGAIDENDIASWFLDPGVKWGAGGVTNDTRCSSTPRGRSRTGPRHTPRSRTCSSRATTSATTSTSRRWRARTNRRGRRWVRCSRLRAPPPHRRHCTSCTNRPNWNPCGASTPTGTERDNHTCSPDRAGSSTAREVEARRFRSRGRTAASPGDTRSPGDPHVAGAPVRRSGRADPSEGSPGMRCAGMSSPQVLTERDRVNIFDT
ncbi:NAD(P)-binding protein [Rhodococcus pyridinivorans]|uniref:NAD(P)-binding protein n=1 Tax=Rhodococcus pyridinivorans TaxID=103816 RepID=UPI00367D912C